MTSLANNLSPALEGRPAGKPTVGRSLWQDARRRLWRDPAAKVCALIILLYILIALGGIGYDIATMVDSKKWPSFQAMNDYKHANEAPSLTSWTALLGTDWSGRSVLVKTLLSVKVSLTVAVMANIIAIPMGMLLGAIAGYYGRWIDNLIVWLYSTLASVPGIVLLIAFKFAFQQAKIPIDLHFLRGLGEWFNRVVTLDLGGIHGVYIALAVTNWIGTCRLVRAETMKIRELDYVVAARACGRSSFGILIHHVIPNVFHIGIISFSLGFVYAISAEVVLSYLGLGVGVGTPSWGSMINSARTDLFAGRWWELTSACTAMFFLVLALNIFGDRLRDALDPKLRNV